MHMKKKIPTFKSDRAAEFVDQADLTQFDLSGATLTRFEIKPKTNQSTCVYPASFTTLYANAPPAQVFPISVSFA